MQPQTVAVFVQRLNASAWACVWLFNRKAIAWLVLCFCDSALLHPETLWFFLTPCLHVLFCLLNTETCRT